MVCIWVGEAAEGEGGADVEQTTQRSPLNSSEKLSKYIKPFFSQPLPLFFPVAKSALKNSVESRFPRTCGEKRLRETRCFSLLFTSSFSSSSSSFLCPPLVPCRKDFLLWIMDVVPRLGLDSAASLRIVKAGRKHCGHLFWTAPRTALAYGRANSERNCYSQPRRKKNATDIFFLGGGAQSSGVTGSGTSSRS